ncbi:MAG: hypothetical protein JOZ46_01310 [Candidatus Dormibacteraeota bacterium]|nr:hypothetical protein [Candidatus Dormibacteraeota bacterium]MBV9524432.1 hypothetical protein [Candidatus Dormibacteraeota bacterium]
MANTPTTSGRPVAPHWRLRRARRGLALLLLGASLAGCAELTIVEATPAPSSNAVTLPPIGFNHRYGNNPVSAKDGFNIERSLYATRQYWEFALRADPQIAGYVNLADPTAVARARHNTKTLLLVLATENGATITGLLAFRSDPGQEMYAEQLFNRVRALGYDNLTSGQMLIFFTEADNHAKLTWSPAKGFAYTVYDNDLRSSALTPGPTQTPLPPPTGP